MPGNGMYAPATSSDHAVRCAPSRSHRWLHTAPPTGPVIDRQWLAFRCTQPPRVVSDGSVASTVQTFVPPSEKLAGGATTTALPFGALTASFARPIDKSTRYAASMRPPIVTLPDPSTWNSSVQLVPGGGARHSWNASVV